ncbi:MAG: cobalamin B12-binding domain-containing protein, partial [Desulfobacterales bacterium]|nr:cobalamin B12-binding domain-containing protein [Desulfobacterales bacterium]
MKVLLIHPPNEVMDRTSHVFSGLGNVLPLWAGYLGVVLEEAGHEVTFLDLQLNQQKTVLQECNVVGISVTTPTAYSGYKIAKLFKENSDAKVVLGGPHVTALGAKVFEECPYVDTLVVGEGEQSILEAIQPSSRRIVSSPFIEDLDSLPIPAYHLFDFARYRPMTGMFKRLPFANILSSRGCPYTCIFCARIWGKKLRMRSVPHIIAEIKFLTENYGIREVAFFDDTFTISRRRTLEFCKQFKANFPRLVWKCSTRVDRVDERLLSAMYDSGCYSVGVGLESGNQRLLNIM